MKKENKNENIINKQNIYDINNINEKIKLEDEKIIKIVMENVTKDKKSEKYKIEDSIINKKVDDIMENIYEQEKNSYNSRLNKDDKSKIRDAKLINNTKLTEIVYHSKNNIPKKQEIKNQEKKNNNNNFYSEVIFSSNIINN